MAKFLDRQEIYRMLERELPEGVYPDGAPSAFFSTADMDSIADVVATGYANLRRVYENQSPQFADEQIDDWVKKMFGRLFDGSVTLAEKRARVIEKIRKQPRITAWEILKLVAGYIPEGKYVQVFEPCGHKVSSWSLGESGLGFDTYLKFDDPADTLGVPADQFCEYVSNLHWRLGSDRLGVNTTLFDGDQGLIQQVQFNAYGYEIRIFDFALTGLDLVNMRADARAAEPARSDFVLRQNLSLVDFGLIVPVTDVDEFDLVDCITRDSTSSTGYSGLKEA